MEHEKKIIEVNGKEFEVLHCLGHGQCVCKSCEAKGKWGLNWTNWFYRLDMDSSVMCYDCMLETLKSKSEDVNA